MINVKTIKKPKKTSTTSTGGGSSAYYRTSTSTDRVPYADNAGSAMYAEKAGWASYAENAGAAMYASEAGVAQDLAEGSDAYNKFLRKDIPDSAAEKITFLGGTLTKQYADFGAFLSDWLLGTGARIDEEGNAEFKSLKVRESLDVAELVFNKISARDAEEIFSPGRGTVESVTITSATTGTITLRLQDNEWSTVASGDICRGIYNNLAAAAPSNWDSGGEDANGFRKKKGFFTSYFQINDVRGSAGSCTFGYTLQTGTTEHPCVNMNFAVYGNVSNTSRQNSIYITSMGIAPRMVFLAGVNTFKIYPRNYKIALGNIAGIRVIEELADASEYNASTDPDKFTETVDGVVHYYDHKTLAGDAGFFCEDNIYLGGVINQFKAAAMATIEASIANVGQAWVLASADNYVVDCNENGGIESNSTFECEFRLFYGSNRCQITSVVATYAGSSHSLIPTVNNEWIFSMDFNEGDSLESGIVSALVTGTYNGVAYSASKTVSITANRRGRKGDAGAAVRFLGPWTASLAPVWNATFRDCVKYNGTYWLVAVPSDGSVSIGVPSSSNANWEDIGAMRFVATELLLAENGTIDLLSSNIINLFNGDNRTASINADGNGSYCIYYLGSGNKRMEFSSNGYIIYYNDDEDNTRAWALGHGGDITKGSSDDWRLFPLHKLTSSEKENLSSASTFELTNYWQFKSGSGGQFSSYDENVYTAIPPNRNPVNGLVIPNGEYTRQFKPYQVLGENGTCAAIEVLTIYNGEIISTTELTES